MKKIYLVLLVLIIVGNGYYYFSTVNKNDTNLDSEETAPNPQTPETENETTAENTSTSKPLFQKTSNFHHFIGEDGVYFQIRLEPKKLEGLNPATTVFKNLWAIDGNLAYYGDEIVTNIDIPSLDFVEGVEEIIVKDKDHVYGLTGYFYNPPVAPPFSILENVDLETVEYLETNFFKDKNNLHYYTKDRNAPYSFSTLPEADVETFKTISSVTNLPAHHPQYFAQDKNHIYNVSFPVTVIIEDADVSSFEIIEDPKWSKDKNFYFYYGDSIDVHYDTFEIKVDGSGYVDFSKDKNYLYLEGEKIEDIDVNGFSFGEEYEHGNPIILKDSDTTYRIYIDDSGLGGPWIDKI